MLVTETTGIKLLPKIIVLNPKDGASLRRATSTSMAPIIPNVITFLLYACRLLLPCLRAFPAYLPVHYNKFLDFYNKGILRSS